MGWCHEFGPQIVATCDHPMVAGRNACSCPDCGTTCKGKFAGCVDVWARGPRQVTVRVRPTEEPVRRARVGPTVDEVVPDEIVHVPAAPPSVPPPRRLDDHSVAVIEQLLDKVRMLESTVEAAAKAPAPAPAPPPMRVPDNARVEAVAKAVGGLAAGLDRLTAEVSELRKVPARLDRLERRPAPAPAGPGGTQALERLVNDVGRLSARVGELSAAGARPSGAAGSSALSETVARLEARVAELDQARTRIEAAQAARPAEALGSDVVAMIQRLDQRVEQLSAKVVPLDDLSKRLASVEAGVGSDTGPSSAQLTMQIDSLSSQVSALAARGDTSRPESPVHAGRINAMEKVVGGLVRSIEHLSSQLGDLDGVPKRLDALETIDRPEGPPIDKVLVSMGKRLDRLSTQVGELKNLPERVRAMEDDPSRNESLSLGLGGAIDMIDQLSAQVAAIEHAGRAGNGAGPGPAPAPVREEQPSAS